MQCAIVHPSELDGSEVARWREFVAGPAFGSPFLAPEFSVVLGTHRPDSRIAVLRDGARIVGFLPYERDPERIGFPIGGGMNDVQALVGEPDLVWDLPDLVRGLGVREWRFDHLLPDQRLFVPFHQSLDRSPVMDLSAGYDAYLEEVREKSSKVLPQVARKRRQLAKEVGPVVTEWRSTRPEDLDQLISWKAAQYERTGARNLFDESWSRDVLREFAGRADGECAGIMSALRAGDHTVALHFGLTRGSVLHWWFPVYDPEFSKYSPGVTLLLDLAAEAPSRGIEVIDLGKGEHGYKLRVANSGYDVANGRVPARGSLYRAAILARHPAWAGRKVRALVDDVKSARDRRSKR
jgi:CelD/BcsL family acetyltransferase involved in cellulose biosynthesis